jgi:putative endonuclease
MIHSTRWYQYVVKCCDGSLYTGVTTDLSRRIDEHNGSSKGAKYTRSRRPVELVYYKEYENRSEAQSAEYKFKKLSRDKKIELISRFK